MNQLKRSIDIDMSITGVGAAYSLYSLRMFKFIINIDILHFLKIPELVQVFSTLFL